MEENKMCLRNRNLVFLIPIKCDKETFNSFNDDFLKNEAIERQLKYDKEHLENIERLKNSIPDNLEVIQSLISEVGTPEKSSKRSIERQDRCQFFQIQKQALRDYAINSHIERKVIKKGRVATVDRTKDLWIAEEDMPYYYIILSRYEYLEDYGVAEIFIDFPKNELIEIDYISSLKLDWFKFKDFDEDVIYINPDGSRNRDKKTFKMILEKLNITVIGEPKLIINSDKSKSLIENKQVIAKLRGGKTEGLDNIAHEAYNKESLNEIAEEFKIKDVKNYEMYISKYALIVDKILDFRFNYTDLIRYLDENEYPYIEFFEIHVLFLYEIATLSNAVLNDFNIVIKQKLNTEQYGEELLKFQITYGKAMSLWSWYAKDPADQKIFEKIQKELQIDELKKEFNELYNQILTIKQTKSEMKDKELAKKLNIIQTVSIIAILAGWLLEILKSEFIPNFKILYICFALIFFIIICIVGYLIYTIIDKKK